MFQYIKNILKKKSKPKEIKINKEDILVLTEDVTYENEVKKSPVKKETKETKSSLTFGK